MKTHTNLVYIFKNMLMEQQLDTVIMLHFTKLWYESLLHVLHINSCWQPRVSDALNGDAINVNNDVIKLDVFRGVLTVQHGRESKVLIGCLCVRWRNGSWSRTVKTLR